MSELFPEHNKNLVNRVLHDGVLLTDEEPASGNTLKTMVALDIVKVTTERYVCCANREDPDYKDCLDKTCPGLIYLDKDVNSYTCPECGRPVYQVKKKQTFTEHGVSLDIPGIKKYIRRVFLLLDLVDTISDDKGGAFKVTLSNNQPLSFCLLDEAESTEQDTLYIQVSPVTGQDISGLHIIELADFLSQPQDKIKQLWSQQLNALLLTIDKLKLLDILATNFNLDEIQDLCFQLQKIDIENLAGETKRAIARELIDFLSRRNRLPELVALIQRQRPGVI